ncbi:MAG: DMT family transporter [Pseudomonadota bacterium]
MEGTMPLWILATLFAASVQALRFLLQKKMSSDGLSAAATTFARFVYAPFVLAPALALWWIFSGSEVPELQEDFWAYAAAGAVAQILATMCVVALFAHRNFAVGIAFSKTTVLLTVGTGFLLLGETVEPLALVAMVVGFAGVVLLSVPLDGGWRIFNRASALGLASGAFFSISAVGYRAASLAVETDLPIVRAAVTLALVTALQTILLASWLAWRDRDGLVQVARRWRLSMLIGLTSMAGSLGWFTAYTLQTAAMVNAVGQIELALSMAISWLLLGERSTLREIAGILLVGISVVGLILIGG